jgi:hypothetical protein
VVTVKHVATVDASLHVYPDCPMRVYLWPEEDRAVVKVGEFEARVVLFVKARELDRLVDVLTDARDRLAKEACLRSVAEVE